MRIWLPLVSLLLAPAAAVAGAPGPAAPAPVKVTAKLDASKLEAGEAREAWLVVSLTSPPRPAEVRGQVNLAIVLDASGSMEGSKLAAAKAAARDLVKLLAPADRVALVAYGTASTVLVPSTKASAEAKARVNAAIGALGDLGSTNLYGGLADGRAEVARHLDPMYANRVVLLSDGLANAGKYTKPEDLSRYARETYEAGISVSAVGFGLDFSEKMMRGIADSGGGSYYFVEKPEALVAAFTAELRTVTSVVGKGTKVVVRPAAGVKVEEVVGYAHEREGEALVVRPGDLYAGVDRKVVLRVRAPAGGPGRVSIGEVEVRYLDAAEKEAARMESVAVAAERVSDAAVAAASRDKEVMALVAKADLARDLEEAAALYDKDPAKAGAKLKVAKAKVSAARKAGYLFADEAVEAEKSMDDLIDMATRTDGSSGKRFKKSIDLKAAESAH